MIEVAIILACWFFSIGMNIAAIKNYNIAFPWYIPAVLFGPFFTLLLMAFTSLSDDMEIRRQIQKTKTKTKLLESKMKEEKTITKYLEP